MKRFIYAAMLLLGLSMTVSGIAQKTNYELELKKCREKLTKDLANHQYDWLYGTWRLDDLNETIIINKDYVYFGEDRSRKEPFNLHYELEDPYSEYLDYDIYLYICNIPVNEGLQCLYFADEYNMWTYEKIADYNEFEDQEIFTIAEEMPEFPGGAVELMKYLNENVKHPKEALEAGIEGRVLLSFIVEPNGTISNVKVTKSLGSGCDEEAVRVIKNMPRWNPGKRHGTPVRVYYTMSVNIQH